jgi:hypothetical protein
VSALVPRTRHHSLAKGTQGTPVVIVGAITGWAPCDLAHHDHALLSPVSRQLLKLDGLGTPATCSWIRWGAPTFLGSEEGWSECLVAQRALYPSIKLELGETLRETDEAWILRLLPGHPPERLLRIGIAFRH